MNSRTDALSRHVDCSTIKATRFDNGTDTILSFLKMINLPYLSKERRLSKHTVFEFSPEECERKPERERQGKPSWNVVMFELRDAG